MRAEVSRTQSRIQVATLESLGLAEKWFMCPSAWEPSECSTPCQLVRHWKWLCYASCSGKLKSETVIIAYYVSAFTLGPGDRSEIQRAWNFRPASWRRSCKVISLPGIMQTSRRKTQVSTCQLAPRSRQMGCGWMWQAEDGDCITPTRLCKELLRLVRQRFIQIQCSPADCRWVIEPLDPAALQEWQEWTEWTWSIVPVVIPFLSHACVEVWRGFRNMFHPARRIPGVQMPSKLDLGQRKHRGLADGSHEAWIQPHCCALAKQKCRGSR